MRCVILQPHLCLSGIICGHISVCLLSFFREIYNIRFRFRNKSFNPAIIFIVSFMTTIFIGSLLLMLPNASNNDIAYVDALFTSTSAVCVTGLTVQDTGVYFTRFGQVVIMMLIQVGGDWGGL